MTATGPVSQPPAIAPPATEKLSVGHVGYHTDDRDELRALWAKLGLGASLPAGVPGVLRSAGGGSAWGLVQAADITPGTITSANIGDGAIQTVDILAGAISASYRAAINTATTSTTMVDVAGSAFNVTLAAGDIYLFGFDGVVSDTTAGAIININYLIGGSNMISIGMHSPPASQYQSLAMSDVLVGSAGTLQHKLQYSTNAGTFSLAGRMHVLVLKR